MNKKHLACVVIILLIAILVQVTLWMRGHKVKIQREADAARAEVSNTTMQLQVERAQLAQLQNSARALIEYLNTWMPYFKAVDSAQNAELKISLRIKQDNLISLSQRYEVIGNPGNAFLPSVMRAQLTFEDDYARVLNWLGQIESELPTLRTSNVRITRGTGGNDLRVELQLDQPLMAK